MLLVGVLPSLLKGPRPLHCSSSLCPPSWSVSQPRHSSWTSFPSFFFSHRSPSSVVVSHFPFLSWKPILLLLRSVFAWRFFQSTSLVLSFCHVAAAHIWTLAIILAKPTTELERLYVHNLGVRSKFGCKIWAGLNTISSWHFFTNNESENHTTRHCMSVFLCLFEGLGVTEPVRWHHF